MTGVDILPPLSPTDPRGLLRFRFLTHTGRDVRLPRIIHGQKKTVKGRVGMRTLRPSWRDVRGDVCPPRLPDRGGVDDREGPPP